MCECVRVCERENIMMVHDAHVYVHMYIDVHVHCTGTSAACTLGSERV